MVYQKVGETAESKIISLLNTQISIIQQECKDT